MKILSALLGVALVVAGGVVIHLTREVGAERQQVADLKAQLGERDARIAALTAASMAPSVAQVAVPVPQAASPVAGSSSPTPAAQQSAAVQEMLAMVRAQSSSPERVAQRRRTTRVLMETSNPDVGEALGLTPDEEDKLLDLLVQNQERTSAVFNAAMEPNGATSVQDRGAALQAAQQENEAEIQAMLGSKYSQWKDYNETRMAWQQRRDLRAVLDAGGIPLTDAQSKALIGALSAEHREFSRQTREAVSQGQPVSARMARQSPERRQRLLDAATPHLSPQQIEGFRGMLDRAAEQERAMFSTLRVAESAAAEVQALPR